MKPRDVILSPEAEADLVTLHDWIAGAAGAGVALEYLNRVEAFITGLELASERGTLRSDIRPGLRVIGFERRLAIAFTVEAERVIILRIFSGGRNWEEESWG